MHSLEDPKAVEELQEQYMNHLTQYLDSKLSRSATIILLPSCRDGCKVIVG